MASLLNGAGAAEELSREDDCLLQNQWSKLTVFLEDGRLEIENNLIIDKLLVRKISQRGGSSAPFLRAYHNILLCK